MTKNVRRKKFAAEKKNCIFFLKSLLMPRHPALPDLKFVNFFIFLWIIFALLDPNPAPADKTNAIPCGFKVRNYGL
jgi:hypothetical protein